MDDLINTQKISGVIKRNYKSESLATYHWANVSITSKGVHYLNNNSAMNQVRSFIGIAFKAALESAIKATLAL